MTRRSPVTSALVGAGVALVLAWNAGLAAAAGGFVAGYLAGRGRRDGGRIGALAGAVAVTPAVVVVLGGYALDFRPAAFALLVLAGSLRLPGYVLAAVGLDITGVVAALAVAWVLVVAIAAVGGILGGYAGERGDDVAVPNEEAV